MTSLGRGRGALIAAMLLVTGCNGTAQVPAGTGGQPGVSGSGGAIASGGTIGSGGAIGSGGTISSGGVIGSGGANTGGGAIGSGGGATAGGGAGGGGGTTGGTPSDCSHDLSGTWDLIAETYGRGPRTGVMVLSPTLLSLQVGATLIYNAQPTQKAVWQTYFSPDPSYPIPPMRAITVSNTPASVDTGSIPLALGGAWTFGIGDEQCSASVGAAVWTANCQGPTNYAGGSDWPDVLPNPSNGRVYTATRTSVMASQFGELGGQWQTTASGGNGGACTITLAGNQVTTHCTDINPISGTMQLTIGSDCVASGMTGKGPTDFGYAISAQRR